ncbi:hypothetical protein FN846DRAFT_904008 [Sphaerosporella brunnea]|uniref:Uncharacterized protein n=1 Tax=Sphaerosporella brunnea TaxID=1250544 RepID=A0A5J5F6Q7_9PEZI|nr:hypothetical protein FN846DRAFT_904008 [Sphaerosporella brunnea]
MAAHMMSAHHEYWCKSSKAYVEVRYQDNRAIHICGMESNVKISRNWTAQSGAKAAQRCVRHNGMASDANHAEKAPMRQAAIPRNVGQALPPRTPERRLTPGNVGQGPGLVPVTPERLPFPGNVGQAPGLVVPVTPPWNNFPRPDAEIPETPQWNN